MNNTNIDIRTQLKQLYPNCKDIKVLWNSFLTIIKADVELLDDRGEVTDSFKDAIYIPGSGGCAVLTQEGVPFHLGALDYNQSWRIKNEFTIRSKV